VSPELEARLQVLEDRAEITQLIAAYGPAADSGDAEAVAALWSDGGTYQFDDTVLDADDIRALVTIPTHVEYLRRGCAHIVSAPRITLDGDRAIAVTHSVVMLREGERWIGERVSANRWELQRTPEGWRVLHRRNRLLDGGADARELLT
jgi:hypothetical protein